MSNGGGGGNGYPLAINVVISATRNKLIKEMTVLCLELALTGTMPGTKDARLWLCSQWLSPVTYRCIS